MEKSLSYKEIIENNPTAAKAIPETAYDWIMDNNEFMDDQMEDMWLKNVDENLDSLYDKCGCVGDGILGLAYNKCVIGIGSGPSYHINNKVLADAYRLNANLELADQPFIFITTNHQFSQCLKDGIHPHFVMAIDATKELNKQLGRIPSQDVENTILIANMYCDPDALKRWVKRGGTVSFFIPENPIVIERFKEKGDPDLASLQSAGNVMNMMWLASLRFLHSQVFFCVGNDLSFDYTLDVKQRAKSFYADGNIAEDHERNQTKDYMAWQGFKFSDSVIDYKPQIDMELRGTSRQLFQYKLWLELHALNFANSKNTKFSYFNCSEQGILGVLAHDWETESLYKRDNWFLLDEICPWYHTSKLADAVSMFLRWRRCLTPMVTRTSAEPVIVLPGRMGGVRGADHSGRLIVSP
jgi:hypothetical protein